MKDIIEQLDETNDEDLNEVRRRAEKKVELSQQLNEEYYNRKRIKAKEHHEGDYVMIANRDITPGINKKLSPKFK